MFNEEDIIEEMIKHHLSQGIELVVLDTGSTDSTYEICKKFSDNDQIKLFQNKATQWDLALNLQKIYDCALKESPDWIIHIDADEFFESGINGVNLKNALERVDKEGYNLVQFDRFEFFITDNDNENSDSITKKLTYYSYELDYLYRAWKFFPGIRNDITGGHYPIFPTGHKYKIYPRKFVCRHYRNRSKNQTIKKLKERIERLEKMPDFKIGWNIHYQKTLEENKEIVVNHNLLTKYNNDNKWNSEKKFSYYTMEFPRREDLFSDNGILKHVPLTYNAAMLTILTLEKKIKDLEHTKEVIEKIHQSFTWKTLRKFDKFKEKL